MPLAVAAVLAVEVYMAYERDYLRTADFDVAFTADGDGPVVRMAVVGDSVVEGVGASSERTSLAGQVATKVAERTGRAVEVRGFGVSGARTRDVAEDQLEELERGEFDVIVIEVGSNDVTHGTRLGDIEAATRRMLERATDLAPIVVFGGAGRLDTTNFRRPLRDVIMWRATQVRQLQARVTDGVDAVDYMNVAKEVSPTYSRTEGSNSEDEFHPSDIGHEIWARPIADLVVERLRDS